MKKIIYTAVLSLLVLAACKENNKEAGESSIPESGNTVFELIDTAESGLNFVNVLIENDSLNVILYEYFYNGSGVSVGDINNDGLQDLFFSSNSAKSKLFLNKGDFKFEDITEPAGIATSGYCSGVTMADINNDGFIDIYVCRSNALLAEELTSNLLYINQGDNTFKEQAKEFGLGGQDYSTVGAFFDYDLDGDLDLYLGNHLVNFMGDFTEYDAYKFGLASGTNRLYRNENNTKFKDVTSEAGLSSQTFTLGISIADFNRDGLPDIYSTSDYHGPDLLYLNNGNGTFTEKQKDHFKHTSYAAMGCDAADYNNDGLIDLMTVDMLPETGFRRKTLIGPSNFDLFVKRWKYGYGKQYMKNTLQLNTGDEKFVEVADLVGVDATDWSWAPLFADFDNDGWKDLFITNGYYRDYTNQDFMNSTVNARYKQDKKMEFEQLVATLPVKRLENYAYKNNRDLTFQKVTSDWGLTKSGVSNGSAYADLDNDGDLDLVVCNINQEAFLYKNTTENSNFVQLKFEGVESNKFGVGVAATLYSKSGKQFLVNHLTRGYNSSVSSMLHFGLGEDTGVDSIVLRWPNGKFQTLTNVEINKQLLVKEENTEVRSKYESQSQKLFTDVSEKYNADVVHDESAYIDFKWEPLLLQMYSKQGPELSVGDVNNDGLEDFILAGTAISSPQLMIQGTNGKFRKQNGPWTVDNDFEESVVHFFDANGDDYPDLYIGNGSNEKNDNGDDFYFDNVYLNKNGSFTEAIKMNVRINTTDVLSHDFDGDGDKDLFLAGGVLAMKYPMSDNCKLLINNGGEQFVDETEKYFSGLTDQMICDEVELADINGDGSPEMIFSGDWNPVTVFSKVGEKWTNITNQTGLDKYRGLWNELEIQDIDNDGDADLIVGNEGYNSQYTASQSKPLVIDYGQLDNNESWDAMISMYFDSKLEPIYSKANLANQMRDFVQTNYKYYANYAVSSTADILGQLNTAQRSEVNHLGSSIFINDGGKFIQKDLPKAAQAAPVEALESVDVNGDGNLDLLVAGNNYNNRVESGWVDGLNGLVLLGDGKGNFKEEKFSGFYVPGNAKNIQDITVDGKPCFIVGINHGKVQLFELNKAQKLQ